MFQSQTLDQHLKTSHTIKTESAVFAEWNLNDTENIEKIGNYRYRPGTTGEKYSNISNIYDKTDVGQYYTGALDSDLVEQSGLSDDDRPTYLVTKNENRGLLYSLTDCTKQHRPRSGINKLLYLGSSANQYLDSAGKFDTSQELLNTSNRPRYYPSSRQDFFKYWTSYRTEAVDDRQEERGISIPSNSGLYYIYDAAPFIVYKEQIPTNKIVIKMQTNVGDVNLGSFKINGQQIPDPLYGYQNQTTPVRWRIEILENNNWVKVMSFDQNSKDESNNPIIKHDGYVEISYGLNMPFRYQNSYVYAGELGSESLLPAQALEGDTFLIKTSPTDKGILKIYDSGTWETIIPEYGWKLSSQTLDIRSPMVTKTNDPDYFINDKGLVQFREFQFIRGIRIVVETMNIPECTFDLIEFSPRLFVDFSDKISSISLNKTMVDLANSSIPVGNIFASTGSLEIFDDDFSFNSNNVFNSTTNSGSIIAKYLSLRIKINLYQIIKQVSGYDYFIPIKVMYTNEIPSASQSTGLISLLLKDFFFYLEASKAPELLMTDVSISYAVSLLLDYIGYSNYVFKRISNIPEIIIPFFFVAPNQNVAEVLQQLAVASQTAMFFDEYNNLVVMSKEYLLPEDSQRTTDSFLFGQQEGNNLPNIINLSSQEKKVYNDGKINYTSRYIQRAVSKYKQINYSDKYQTYGYKPVLLWEVSGRENLRTKNEIATNQSGYTLSALPLNSSLSSDIPVVSNNQVINNVIDVGENIDAGVGGLSSYQGYLYANGEIIKFDAVEYSISGNLNDGQTGNVRWISSNQEYQKYFSKLPFNGKMYPTGNIRIYSEPEYETIGNITKMKNGAVKKHGRGQFGTPITTHQAGLDSYWSNNDNTYGCLQKSKEYLFNTSQYINYPAIFNNVAGKTKTVDTLGLFNSDQTAKGSVREGIIKNYRANKYYTENETNYFNTSRVGTLQSSALVFTGPPLPGQIKKSDFVSYIYKDLSTQTSQAAQYKHFGTRMRIIGQIEANSEKTATPYGSFQVYDSKDINISGPESSIQIFGGSGGLAFNLNKDKNTGYYFELVALSEDNISDYVVDQAEQFVSYKLLKTPAASCVNNVVTVTSETQINFVVGQRIIISGLVDSLNPVSTNTPLNGEYTISAINTDGKTFKYTIPGPIIPDRTSITGGTAFLATNEPNSLANIYFYKVVADSEGNAVPYKLWSGISNIIVDDGKFTGQYRFTGEKNPTVYDVSAEYVNVGTSKVFYLYINGKQIATVTDTDPLPDYNGMGLFVRGSSKCMFENVYALAKNISENNRVPVAYPLSKVWGDDEISISESFKKYALSGMIQQTYLTGLNVNGSPSYVLYFDEFGTIMREAAYFNIKYDRAYPALYAKMMKTYNNIKGYTVSGFYAGSYGAEFLIFNCTDANLNLDDTTGNFLRISGITFTQATTRTLSVDDYFKKFASLSDPVYSDDGNLYNPNIAKEEYNQIINSRSKYGVNEFTIQSDYIQTDDAAEDVFGWTIKKISKPKIIIGINTFGTFNLQLGDIVQINYKNNEGLDVICSPNKRFVIYNIQYNKSLGQETTTTYLAEI